MGEIGAIKTEISEAIVRRVRGDSRSPADMFGVTVAAVSETLADLIFAAAKSEDHGRRLLDIAIARIESRWRELSAKGAEVGRR